jgi:predicted Zn-dependent protease
MPAVVTVSERGTAGSKDHIRVLSHFIEYEGRVYVFHGVAPAQTFGNHQRTFQSTMTSFNRLTDASKLNRQATRLRVREVPQTGTLAEAFRKLGVPQDKMEELALLNNMELKDQVQSGRLIKTISEK